MMSSDDEVQLTLITCKVTGTVPANQQPRVVIPLSNFRSRAHPSRQILASRSARPPQLTPGRQVN
jgi:hypothetical protein